MGLAATEGIVGVEDQVGLVAMEGTMVDTEGIMAGMVDIMAAAISTEDPASTSAEPLGTPTTIRTGIILPPTIILPLITILFNRMSLPNMNWKPDLLVLFTVVVLSGCATMPIGPTVSVMPSPGKPYEVFMADEGVCRDWAQHQIGGTSPSQTANENLAAGAVVGTMVGAGLGALIGAATGNAGAGAAIGAGAGLLGGTSIGATEGAVSGYQLQRRYDIAYQQCMYSKGNQIPGVVRRPAPAYAPPPPSKYYPPPPDRSQAPPSASQGSGGRIFIYPRQSQNEEQQAKDFDVCHSWAVGQTGFDPSKPPAGRPDTQTTQKNSDYLREVSACLDGRGYTLR